MDWNLRDELGSKGLSSDSIGKLLKHRFRNNVSLNAMELEDIHTVDIQHLEQQRLLKAILLERKTPSEAPTRSSQSATGGPPAVSNTTPGAHMLVAVNTQVGALLKELPLPQTSEPAGNQPSSTAGERVSLNPPHLPLAPIISTVSRDREFYSI